jgi:hypothetical protein
MIEGRKKEMVIGNIGYSRVGMEAALWRENILFCLVSKKISIVFVTSNFWTPALNIKYS